MTTTTAGAGTVASTAAPKGGFARWAFWHPCTWRAAANAMWDLLLGVSCGVIVLVLLSVGASSLLAGIGVVIVLLALIVSHGLAAVWRYERSAVLGVEIPGYRWPRRRPDQSWWVHVGHHFIDKNLWKEAAHSLVMLFLGPIWFSLVVAFWALGLAATAYLVYAPWIPDGDPVDWGSIDPRDMEWRLLAFVIGVLLLFVAGWITQAAAYVDTLLARALLGPSTSEALREQVSTLRTTRAAVVETADAERRRIERDLHDQVQPELVSLAMNIALARRRLANNPAAADELLAQAHDEAKHAIVELRNVIRGVHPAILSERGLDAALSALAARSPVPVTIDVDIALERSRPPATTEAVAYFVVAEALTNVARHAQASHATVIARWREPVAGLPGMLQVWVVDNGRGGATPLPGSGLAGLSDRAAAVDGRLAVTSPPGRGTTIYLELPCAS